MKRQGISGRSAVVALSLILCSGIGRAGSAKRKAGAANEVSEKAEKVFWQEPADIASRNLLFGQGGKEHAPSGTAFEFRKEDMDATNPKFNVRDANGVKWKIKLGDEAKPETVATRLVWAAGYTTDEDYFLPEVQVKGLPGTVHRGKEFISSNGTMRNARLEREIADEKKAGEWKWATDPFSKTREWNGLRVLMALINNWDLKDENNSVYEVGSKGETKLVYVVSDLGATFGPEHLDLGRKTNKGDLKTYQHTSFIRRTRANDVDFTVPGAPSPIMIFSPAEYFRRRKLMWIGQHVPREDARWMGRILARLSGPQIRDAFRAGGYSAEEVEAYASIVEKRIAALTEL